VIFIVAGVELIGVLIAATLADDFGEFVTFFGMFNAAIFALCLIMFGFGQVLGVWK
jgi:hypothetical protein